MSTQNSFIADFKQFFGRGLAILLPSVLTLWILFQLGIFLYDNVGRPINRGIRLVIIQATPLLVSEEQLPSWFAVTDDEVRASYEERDRRALLDMTEDQRRQYRDRTREKLRRDKFREFWNRHWYLEMTGLVVAVILIYFAGRFLGGLIGRRMYGRVEKGLARLPGFKQVYPHVKQVVDLIIGDRPHAFNKVVLIEYPRKGIWTVGLVTGTSLRRIKDEAGHSVLSVFVPSTPTPFTGFTVTVRTDEAIDLPISVDEAIRFFITGGVLVPEHQSTPEASSMVPPPSAGEGAKGASEGDGNGLS